MLEKLKLLLLFLPFGLQAQQMSFALEQINAQALVEEGLTGKGIKVGIIDGGFLRANTKEALQHLFDNNLVMGYRDFLDSSAADFSGSRVLDDVHGTEVWEMIAGHSTKKGIQYGLATGAMYYLARTDHGAYERREEERNAIKAMEWMAAEGVQIINLSLGYNYGYTRKEENYQPTQMDGESTILTQAVDRISEAHDILIVVAAGNDGDKKWRIIDSPADAKSALTVGATKFKTKDDMAYSSKGPHWLAYVKPEVACFAGSGTSFSTPIITGFAACILEKNPTLSAAALKTVIMRSANLKYPNNFVGYGVPNAAKALRLLQGDLPQDTFTEISTTKSTHKLTFESKVPYLSIYHKKGWEVLSKEFVKPKKNEYRVKKVKDAESSTILWTTGELEIFWEK